MELLGDPHLGRVFKTGVPLDRRGDREESQWGDFEKSLRAHNEDVHICMGDLFDKFIVPPEVVLRATNVYLSAAIDLQWCKFYVIRGNHDVSRDTSKGSSWDIFTQLVAGQDNIHVVNDVRIEGKEAFIPYDPFVPVVETVEGLPDNLTRVFMHHDYVDFGGNQVIPTELLASKGIFEVINGHDHVARVEQRHGVTVTMTGSMQPYTHAEDKDGSLYVTTTLSELMEMDVSNKNVRVLLQEGEELPTDLDCLSLTAKRIQAETEVTDTEDFDSFDIRAALADAVHPLVKDAIMEQFNDY